MNRIILSCVWQGVQSWFDLLCLRLHVAHHRDGPRYGGQMVKVMIGAIWRALSRIPGPFSTLRMQGFSELLQHEEPLPTRHRDGDERLQCVFSVLEIHNQILIASVQLASSSSAPSFFFFFLRWKRKKKHMASSLDLVSQHPPIHVHHPHLDLFEQ